MAIKPLQHSSPQSPVSHTRQFNLTRLPVEQSVANGGGVYANACDGDGDGDGNGDDGDDGGLTGRGCDIVAGW